MTRPWWEQRGDAAGAAVAATLRRLDDNQRHRHDHTVHCARMYSNTLARWIAGDRINYRNLTAKLRMNTIKAVIDTATSHISTVRSRPRFLTDGGSHAEQTRAKNLSKFVLGQFLWADHYACSRQIFRDAAIFGTGIAMIRHRTWTDKNGKLHGDVIEERVMPNEVVVDEVDGLNGKPRQLFRHKTLGREAAKAIFPKKFHKAIDEAEYVRDNRVHFSHNISDPISVIEAWYLPTLAGTGGKHIITLNNTVLFEEEWKRPDFPFVFFHWSSPVGGFWGSGLVDELTDMQVEMNFLLQKIQRMMTLATSKVLAEEGTVNREQFSNDDWGVVEYARGRPAPVFTPIQSISGEYFAQIDRLHARMFETAGVSQLSATGMKPAGLESGVALRESQDIESKRFQDVQQAWEEYHMRCAHQYVEAAKQLDEALPGGYRLLAKGDRSLEALRFNQVDLSRDRYQIQIWPSNMLPKTPAGRIEMIQALAQISPELSQNLIAELNFPDTEEAVSLVSADGELADHVIEQMLDRGEYRPPDQFMNLPLTMGRVRLALLRAETRGVPDDRLQLLRDFLVDADAILRGQEAAAMQAAEQQLLRQQQLQQPDPGAVIAGQEGV
jgi:hypothetical protein